MYVFKIINNSTIPRLGFSGGVGYLDEHSPHQNGTRQKNEHSCPRNFSQFGDWVST